MPQRPDFSREVFQAKLLAVDIPPTGKKLVASGAFVDLSFAQRDKFARVIGVISKYFAYNDVITMTSAL